MNTLLGEKFSMGVAFVLFGKNRVRPGENEGHAGLRLLFPGAKLFLHQVGMQLQQAVE